MTCEQPEPVTEIDQILPGGLVGAAAGPLLLLVIAVADRAGGGRRDQAGGRKVTGLSRFSYRRHGTESVPSRVSAA